MSVIYMYFSLFRLRVNALAHDVISSSAVEQLIFLNLL